MRDIISKWTVKYKDWDIAITKDNRVFCVNTKIELVEYCNNGVLSYRIPRTTRRIGVKTLRKYCKLESVPITFFCPF